MKNTHYVAPMVEATEVALEQGFAVSATTNPYENENWN